MIMPDQVPQDVQDAAKKILDFAERQGWKNGWKLFGIEKRGVDKAEQDERQFLGAFELQIQSNNLGAVGTVIADHERGIYRTKVYYIINGSKRDFHLDIPMATVESGGDITDMVRIRLIEEISNFITRKVVEDNHKVLVSASKQLYS